MPQETSSFTGDRLISLEAQLESLRGDKEAALRSLGQRTDPASVRRRLAILIQLRRVDDAAALVGVLDPAEAWADLGAFALAATGADTDAEKYVVWARAQKAAGLPERTGVLYVDAMMGRAFKERADGVSLAPGILSEQEEKLLRKAAGVIEPLCKSVLARGSVETEVQSQLLQRYFDN